jgi:hypothetical protein
MDHRPANLRSPLREILVHHDHIDWSANSPDSVTQTDGLRDAVLNVTLNDQEVQIAVGRELTARCRPEQDHLGRRSCSPRETQASQFDRFLCGHDEAGYRSMRQSPTNECEEIAGLDDHRIAASLLNMTASTPGA